MSEQQGQFLDAWFCGEHAASDSPDICVVCLAAEVEALRAQVQAAWDAAWDAAWYAARDAAGYAAWSLVARDLISTDAYDTLTRPWGEVIGPIHPDDPDMRRGA